MDNELATLQSAVNEASLILECAAYLLESEHPNANGWREMVAILNGLARDRLRDATGATAALEVRL